MTFKIDRIRIAVLPRKEFFVSYDTSRYSSEKVRITLLLPKNIKEKYRRLCDMFGVGESTLFSLLIDEMYYEPMSPTLPKTIENSTQRVFSFFRKSQPRWTDDERRYYDRQDKEIP